MRAAGWPGGDYRGRHQRVVLAEFRPTWRQSLAVGLGWALLASFGTLVVGWSALLAPTVVDAVAGTDLRAGVPLPAGFPPDPVWLAALWPVALVPPAAVVVRRRQWLRLDECGVNYRCLRGQTAVPWREAADVRAERHSRRTVIALYRADGTVLRLPVPYDGDGSDRDPRFEQKLFLFCHLWETHRDCVRSLRRHPGGEPGVPVA